MTKKTTKKIKRSAPVTHAQIARILYRTMKIEEPKATRKSANRVARTIRLPK